MTVALSSLSAEISSHPTTPKMAMSKLPFLLCQTLILNCLDCLFLSVCDSLVPVFTQFLQFCYKMSIEPHGTSMASVFLSLLSSISFALCLPTSPFKTRCVGSRDERWIAHAFPTCPHCSLPVPALFGTGCFSLQI